MSVVPISKHVAYERSEKLSVSRTLKQAAAAKLAEVLVVGFDEDGDLFVVGHPNSPGDALFLMELAKRRLTGG